MRVVIGSSKAAAKDWLADDMSTLIQGMVRDGNQQGVVLPTGSTYEDDDGVYAKFAEQIRAAGMDLAMFPFFNMDAYLQRNARRLELLARDNEIGYQYYMKRQLFDRLGIAPLNHHFPTPDSSASEHRQGSLCTAYTSALQQVGFAKRVYGGIGQPVAHAAFNIAGSKRTARARVVLLSREERETNARIYQLPLADIPKYAATIGLWEMFRSNSVILAAFGSNKADVVRLCVEDDVTTDHSAQVLLREHSDATLLLDQESASKLARPEQYQHI